MSYATILAEFIVKTNYEDIPSEVISVAKERLLDTIGAMIAGRAGWAYGDALIEAVKPLGAGCSRVLGPDSASRFPAARAAMLDATFAHAIELDDGHTFAGVHAGAVVVPTALVMGEELHASGKEVLAAIVLGYEAVYRMAVAQSPELIDHGFHPSATCDTVGAMAVTGKLMKLNAQQLANGLGMSALQAAGLMEATVTGQQSKCVMVGNAAFNGIACAYVARAGLEGCTSAFDGKTGLFQAMSKPIAAEDVLRDLGQVYSIGNTYNKFYPTCRHAQPAIEAALNLAEEHGIDPDQVDHIEVGTHRVAYELTGRILAPQTPGEAKFSIAYGIAAALEDRGVAVRHLTAPYYTDEKYLKVARKVTTRIDERVAAQYPKRRGAAVDIHMRNGQVFSADCYDLKGSPQNPVGFDELVKKFKTAATGLLNDSAIEKVLDLCGGFETADAKDLLLLLNW